MGQSVEVLALVRAPSLTLADDDVQGLFYAWRPNSLSNWRVLSFGMWSAHFVHILMSNRKNVNRLQLRLPRSNVISGITLLLLWAYLFCAPITMAADTRVHTSPLAQSHSFQLHDLSAKSSENVVPTALNKNGEIVGRLWHPGIDAFVFYDGKITMLPPPHGFRYSGALGLSDAGAILVEAWNQTQLPAFFVAQWKGNHYTWTRIRSGLPGFTIKSAAHMAANGDVVGTLRGPHGTGLGRLRAAAWRYDTGMGYARAVILPLPVGFRSSSGSVIWSDGMQTVATGCTYNSTSTNCLVFWAVRHHGLFRVSLQAVAGGNSSISTIGGWGAHVYVGGPTGNNETPGWPWGDPVRFNSSGVASISEISALPAPETDAQFGAVTSVSASQDGKLVAVGAYSAEPRIGLLWQNGLAETIARLVPGTSWSFGDPMAINLNGQIIGLGTVNGQQRAFLLTPSRG